MTTSTKTQNFLNPLEKPNRIFLIPIELSTDNSMGLETSYSDFGFRRLKIAETVWIFNPLFSFFVKFKWWVDISSNNFNETIDFFRVVTHLEFQTHCTNDHLEKLKILMADIDSAEEFVWNPKIFLTEDSTVIPVLCMNYLYSLYLATLPNLRNEFYKIYNGKVPAITQFLLNSIRIGRLNDQFYVSEIKLDKVMDEIDSCGLDCSSVNSYPTAVNANLLKVWFESLEKLFADNTLFFSHFVSLEKVPLALGSKQTLTLTGFNQHNHAFLTNANVENSKSKEKYHILNKAVNAHLVLKKDYDQDQEDQFGFTYEGKLIGEDKFLEDPDLEDRDLFEFDLAEPFLEVISNCNLNDV